jgi:transposase-like protein
MLAWPSLRHRRVLCASGTTRTTFGGFHSWFAGEESCLAFLERLRWPEGFVCPSCGAIGEPWRMRRGRLRCRACRYETSATAGTIFADTKLPLATWFQTIWLVTNQKHGTSALDLQRAIGMSYETAWMVLHKLRRAMVRQGRESLSGVVEVDETYVGGVVPGRRGRGALGKAIVAISVERLGVGEWSKRVALGRVRLQRIPNVQLATLTDFVLDTCDLDAVIHTDHWVGYNDLGNVGFTHVKTNISASGDPAHIAMPCVHRVASLLKRWLLGTHQGGVSIRQLDFYLDEFVFRFNRRKSRSRGLLFYRLMEQAVATAPQPAKVIIGGRP